MRDRVALITNFLPPYRIPVLTELHKLYSGLDIWLSTPMETHRQSEIDPWHTLPVTIQKGFSLSTTWRQSSRFTEPATLHFPIDTFLRLVKARPRVTDRGYALGLRTSLAALYRLCDRRNRLVIWTALSEVTESERGTLRGLLRRILLRLGDAVIVNGASGRRYVEKYGAASSKIFIVPQTTDIQRFFPPRPTQPSGNVRRLLFSGSLSERKNISSLLDHLVRWTTKHPDVQVELDPRSERDR